MRAVKEPDMAKWGPVVRAIRLKPEEIPVWSHFLSR
jgi:hypothetical protein